MHVRSLGVTALWFGGCRESGRGMFTSWAPRWCKLSTTELTLEYYKKKEDKTPDGVLGWDYEAG